jgi:hypothetical protein
VNVLQDNWEVIDMEAETRSVQEEQPLPSGWEERTVCLSMCVNYLELNY